jgi:hypothetical protein
MANLDQNIATLRDEAAAAGDREMVAICTRALAGHFDAIVKCERVINAAAVTYWTSADGQAEIEVRGTKAQARAELLRQCSDNKQRAAILAGSFA